MPPERIGKARIAEFGLNDPILVDTKAAMIAGYVLDHLTEAQRPYIIADNQLAPNAGCDQDLLGAELAALQAEEFNIDLLGFEGEELSRLLAAHPNRSATAAKG